MEWKFVLVVLVGLGIITTGLLQPATTTVDLYECESDGSIDIVRDPASCSGEASFSMQRQEPNSLRLPIMLGGTIITAVGSALAARDVS